jgi:hypothetical protein
MAISRSRSHFQCHFSMAFCAFTIRYIQWYATGIPVDALRQFGANKKGSNLINRGPIYHPPSSETAFNEQSTTRGSEPLALVHPGSSYHSALGHQCQPAQNAACNFKQREFSIQPHLHVTWCHHKHHATNQTCIQLDVAFPLVWLCYLD